MPQHFLDSSALLKRYREEIGSQWMFDLPRTSNRLVVARLAHVEVTSAIIRRRREPGNRPEQVVEALAALDREMEEFFEVIELEGTVIASAVDLARRHALRAADAVQLACALLSHPGPPESEFYLVSADNELNAAAQSEGLRVENPNLHP
jgi:hypothetical protein